MNTLLEQYKNIISNDSIEQIYQLGKLLSGIKLVHVNSTREGGGVAEILHKMLPLTQSLGIDTRWEVLEGEKEFFECTKAMHNLLQGQGTALPSLALLKTYEENNAKNAALLRPILEHADLVIIHDPQPLPLLSLTPQRKGKWIWRCHIDVSTPQSDTWNYLRQFIAGYDASIFSLEDFVQPFPHPIFIIPPSIDPLSEKNIALSPDEIAKTYHQLSVDPLRPTLLQVSRFDRFKDPVGVIEAYRQAKTEIPSLQLILAGGGAPDDPEGEAVFNEVKNASQGDPDVHLLSLPSDSHRTINALQRGATIILQKSIKEGFGLTVSEGLWKGKPVIGGNTGGIRLQILDGYTGYLASTPREATGQILDLLYNPQKCLELGSRGRDHVRENFLITRHLREYLTLIASLLFGKHSRIDLGKFQNSGTK